MGYGSVDIVAQVIDLIAQGVCTSRSFLWQIIFLSLSLSLQLPWPDLAAMAQKVMKVKKAMKAMKAMKPMKQHWIFKIPIDEQVDVRDWQRSYGLRVPKIYTPIPPSLRYL
jgi:hypothetical protein